MAANAGRKGSKKNPKKSSKRSKTSIDKSFAQKTPKKKINIPLKKFSIILAAVLLLISVSFTAYTVYTGRPGELKIAYPFDGAVFPPEIIAPKVWWDHSFTDANKWRITIDLNDGGEVYETTVDTCVWMPDREIWEAIKERSKQSEARLTVTGFISVAGWSRSLANQTITFSTSNDPVGAPIYFRDVPLPFRYALRNVSEIKWRLGDISSYDPPQTVLEGLPVCGNCHSFSADGKTLGMDVDVGNDKGAYVISEFSEETVFSKDKVISWYDYYGDRTIPTFGLLARLSPDGRYVVSGIKDRAVFLIRNDLAFSQLFFPVLGTLVYHDTETGEIKALPGADNPDYNQCNGVWTPDGKYITFARAASPKLKSRSISKNVTLDENESAEILGGMQYLYEEREGGKRYTYDLYRLPFNNGKGGKPEPVPGASNNGMSNFFPKYSPDGKWLVFTQTKSFMLLRPDSKLYIMPAEGGEPRLMNCNTELMNSWHSWSPNSKWLVFASKAFTPYTQLFITHIDENGNDTPPVLLHNFVPPDRAVNIPEFVNMTPGEPRTIVERFIDDYNYYRGGIIYQQFGQYDKAEREYVRALEENPDNYLAHQAMGDIYARKKQYDKAEESFKKVINLEPDHAAAYFNLGSVYALTEKPEKALHEYDRFLNVEKDDEYFIARAHICKGRVYYDRKDYENAKSEFERGIRFDRTNQDAYIFLGNVYLRKGEIQNAVNEFNKALNIDPEIPGLKKKVDELVGQIGKNK